MSTTHITSESIREATVRQRQIRAARNRAATIEAIRRMAAASRRDNKES